MIADQDEPVWLHVPLDKTYDIVGLSQEVRVVNADPCNAVSAGLLVKATAQSVSQIWQTSNPFWRHGVTSQSTINVNK